MYENAATWAVEPVDDDAVVTVNNDDLEWWLERHNDTKNGEEQHRQLIYGLSSILFLRTDF